MPGSSEALLELLRHCTVRFFGASQCTGFFVAPERILTCAHVVEDMHDNAAPITIERDGKPYPATILDYRAKPYPDLALLRVDLDAHPCVYLDGAINVGDSEPGFTARGARSDPDRAGCLVCAVETCRRLIALRLEGTGLDPASFSEMFQSPRQPRDLLHAAAARYEALAARR